MFEPAEEIELGDSGQRITGAQAHAMREGIFRGVSGDIDVVELVAAIDGPLRAKVVIDIENCGEGFSICVRVRLCLIVEEEILQLGDEGIGVV